MKATLAIVAALLAGCAEQPLQPGCDQPYSESLMHCDRRRRGPPLDVIEICDVRGHTADCYYVERHEVEHELRQITRPVVVPRPR